MKKTLMMVALLLGIVRGAYAMNPPDADVAKEYVSHNVSLTSLVGTAGQTPGDVGATIYYIGTSTEGVVQWLQGGATFYAPAGTVDTTVGDSGTSGTYNFANVTGVTGANTMGKVCSSINRSANWRCVLGGLSSNDSSTLIQSTTGVGSNGLSNAVNPGGFTLFTSTGGTFGITSSVGGYNSAGGLSNSTNVFTLSLGLSPTATTHRVVLRKCYANTADTTGTFRVFGRLRQFEGMPSGGVPDVASGYDGSGTSLTKKPAQGGIGTKDDNSLVYQALEATSANTDATYDFTLAQFAGGLEFAKGAHVVVKVGFGTTVQGSANYLQCLWDDLP